MEGDLLAQLGGLECMGNESDIFDCPHSGDVTTCGRFSDAGVVCQGKYL